MQKVIARVEYKNYEKQWLFIYVKKIIKNLKFLFTNEDWFSSLLMKSNITKYLMKNNHLNCIDWEIRKD